MPPALGGHQLPSLPLLRQRNGQHVALRHLRHLTGAPRPSWTCLEPLQGCTASAFCGHKQDLWICLICGHVGCGRYRAGHAADHWRAGGHAYALELEAQRVWDYAADGYVHRLIQSKTDGKLVEVPRPAPPSSSRTAPPG